MAASYRSKSKSLLLVLALGAALSCISFAQVAGEDSFLSFDRLESLNLAPEITTSLKQSLQAHDYLSAEKILLAEVNRNPRSASVLSFLGGVYFLNRDYWNAAIAWNKAAAIGPLPPRLQFSLAMAYVRVGHPEWSRTLLTSLAKAHPDNSLYPYWMGRLDYDAQAYQQAVDHFKEAIRLYPAMSKSYDNLGLCYFYLNQNELAIENYRKAIELERGSPLQSAWPYLNLAITLEFMNRQEEAETDLRKAISIDTKLPQAHFQLGKLLERKERMREALDELLEAAHLDPSYAEPHFLLARIYRRQGKQELSQQEVNTYNLLHEQAESPRTPPAPASQYAAPQNSTRPAN